MEDTLNGGASFPYCRDHVSEVCRSALSFIFFRINTAACDALIRIYTKCWRGSETRETKTKTLWYKWGDEVKAGQDFHGPHSRVLLKVRLSTRLPDSWSRALSMMPHSGSTLSLFLCSERIKNATVWLSVGKKHGLSTPRSGFRLWS